MSEKDSIPPPPTPPENRVECSSCGYIAPKTEYYRVHGTRCVSSTVMIVAFLIGVASIFGTILFVNIAGNLT